MKWLNTYEGRVWRYASPLRPITQLPLEQLDIVIDPDSIGKDTRVLNTARELTAAEVSGYELEELLSR